MSTIPETRSSIITEAIARRVWDSRGDPTMEVELRCAGGGDGRGIAPAGASTGRFEAVELRDESRPGDSLSGRDVHTCIARFRATVAPALIGLDAAEPGAIDARLEEIDPQPGFRHIGGNAAIATSFAAHATAARIQDLPLWRHLGAGAPQWLPRPEIQVIGGGAHAAGRLDLQDLMVVPLGAITFAEGLDRVARIHRATRTLLEASGRFGGYADEGGFWPWFKRNEDGLEVLTRAIEAVGLKPGEDVALSVDVAASQLAGEDGRLTLTLESRTLEPTAFADWLCELTRRWPITLLEDPLPEDQVDATADLARRLPGTCRIVGDDLVATSAELIERAATACGAVLIKPNQAGTVTRARAALAAAEHAGMLAITSARSGETEDADIVDYAVGWRTPMIKIGALARGERTAKWNRMLRISESLGDPDMAPMD